MTALQEGQDQEVGKTCDHQMVCRNTAKAVEGAIIVALEYKDLQDDHHNADHQALEGFFLKIRADVEVED